MDELAPRWCGRKFPSVTIGRHQGISLPKTKISTNENKIIDFVFGAGSFDFCLPADSTMVCKTVAHIEECNRVAECSNCIVV